MAVLIEALTLVVPKIVLDVSIPGATDAFLEFALHLPQPPRFICSADELLVSLSFYNHEHARPAVEFLESHHVAGIDAKTMTMIEMVLVDQRYGPEFTCEWLSWEVHRDGFTYAWVAGSEPGDMAAPEDWTPAQSLALTRTDRRDDPDMLLLAREGDHDSWLDLATGVVSVGMTRPLDDRMNEHPR